MKAYERLEAALDARGFLPMTKHIVLRGLAIAMLAMVAGGVTIAYDEANGRRLFWFGLAGLFSIWNFFALASHVHQNISNGWKSISLKLIISTQIRLFVTGILIYFAYASVGAPLIPMFMGVALPMLCIVLSLCLPRG